jgi:hypothetical protein
MVREVLGILFVPLQAALHLAGLVLFVVAYRGARARIPGRLGYAFLTLSGLVALTILAVPLRPEHSLFVWFADGAALLRLWGVLLVLATLFASSPRPNDLEKPENLVAALLCCSEVLLFAVLGPLGEIKVSSGRGIPLEFPRSLSSVRRRPC